MRIAIYARYSSDLQNPNSVRDQTNACREYAKSKWPDMELIATLADEAVSGSSLNRPGIQQLLQLVRMGDIDIIVAEGLDRITRSLKDSAAIHELAEYHSVKLFTLQEGELSDLHIGFKGTQNKMFLKDLKDKTRRGHKAAIKEGRIPGGIAYGYEEALDKRGRVKPGERVIVPEKAAVIRRIFEEFAAGDSCADIARRLNKDGIPSARGGTWKRERILGTRSRGDGILSNPIYTGEIVWNRRQEVKNPETGKRKAIMRDNSEVERIHNESLRIISDELWDQAQARRTKRSLLGQRVARTATKARKLENKAARVANPVIGRVRPLTFLIFCGVCGSHKKMAGRTRYICDGSRHTGICKNARGWSEKKIFEHLLPALDARLKDQTNLLQNIHAVFDDLKRQEAGFQQERDEIRLKLSRILKAVEDGLNIPEAVERSEELNMRLLEIEKKILSVPFPDRQREAVDQVKTGLQFIKDNCEEDATANKIHSLLKTVVRKIVFTPIPNKRKGETMEIEFDDSGWPEFWRLSFDT